MNFKSLYGKQAITDAIDSTNGQYGITIEAYIGKSPNMTMIPIKGILKESISFGVNANWSTLGLESIIQSIAGSNPILGAIDTFVDVANAGAGSSFTNTGIFTKLFYKNSGRLSISPTFRVFDYNGSGICTRVASVLSSLCVPTIGDKIELSDAANTLIKTKNDVMTALSADITKAPTAVQHLNQNVDIAIRAIGDSNANWSDAPNPVNIKIGQWLSIQKAVVEDVSFTFSYDSTDAGPLWVDVAMKLETIENLAIDKNGNLQQIQIGNSQNTRVQIVESNQIFK